MLYAISQELGLALKAQGVPFPVVHALGSEPAASVTAGRERVVLVEPIDKRGDQILPPRGTHPNPMMPARSTDAGILRIYARSSLSGAVGHDHADRARLVRDHVIAELDAIVRGRKNVLAWGAGGLTTLDDAEGSTVWGGAVYELEFTIDRGVFRRTWAGKAHDEVVIGTDVAIVNTTKVSSALGAAGTPPVGAETASGG